MQWVMHISIDIYVVSSSMAVVPADSWEDSRPRSESQLSRSFPTGGELPSISVCVFAVNVMVCLNCLQLSGSPLSSVLQLLLLFLPKTFRPGVITAVLQTLLVNLAASHQSHSRSKAGIDVDASLPSSSCS